MSVYVDLCNYSSNGRKWGHLVADTEEELHELAEAIGLKRKWFQNRPGGIPHYDVTRSKRDKAIKAGAKEINYNEMKEFIKNYRTTESTQAKEAI